MNYHNLCFPSDEYLTQEVSGSKTLILQKKRKLPRIFQSLHKLRRGMSVMDEAPPNLIIIDDDEVHKTDEVKTHELPFKTHELPFKTHELPFKKPLKPHFESDEDCIILEKKNNPKKSKKRVIHLDFRNKGKDKRFLDFRRLRRRSILKGKRNDDHLRKILGEISESHNLKVSEQTLKSIIEDLNRELNKTPIQIIEDDEEAELGIFHQQILKQSVKTGAQKNRGIRIGEKFQSSIPSFEQFNIAEMRKQQKINKVWDRSMISNEEFKEIRKLVETILRINSINEEFLCEIIAQNNYKIQDTTKYCFENQKELQAKFLQDYVGETSKSRKTRNSMYGKYFVK